MRIKMIDYEKLKIAIDLCKNSSIYYFLIEFCPVRNSDEIAITLMDSSHNRGDSMGSLDDLIENLRELTKPQPKYKIGQAVWMTVVNDFRLDIDEDIIRNSVFKDEGWFYNIKSSSSSYLIHENELFPTRESLIEAQIEYWQSMLPETPELTPQRTCDKCNQQIYGEYRCPCVLQPDTQINQPEVDVDRCLHEPDISEPPKLSHFTSEEGCVFIVTCKKCGEFF